MDMKTNVILAINEKKAYLKNLKTMKRLCLEMNYKPPPGLDTKIKNCSESIKRLNILLKRIRERENEKP